MTRWAQPADVERASQRWTDGQVACRTYAHNWRPLSVTHRPGIFTISQRCQRCRNERRQEINEQGYPVSGWKMTYREGYLLTNLGRVGIDGRAVLRLAALRNMDILEEPDDE